MTDNKALLQAICDNPDDDAPRLVYSGWLEEQGDALLAEFIRVQCALEPLRDRHNDPRRQRLWQREDQLLVPVRDRLSEELWVALPNFRGIFNLQTTYRRGFVDSIGLPAKWLIQGGDVLRPRFPLLQEVAVFRVNGWGEQLAACPHLQGLRRLELPCWYSQDDLRAIASSPHLGDLEVLRFWVGNSQENEDELCRQLVASTAWPRLREFWVVDPHGGDRDRWTGLVNRVAGRDLARYFDPHEFLFPFAVDFHHTIFPGRLPDGVQVFAEHLGFPDNRLQLLFFDGAGRQLREQAISLPADCVEPIWEVGGDHAEYEARQQNYRERVIACLRAEFGFEPAFIRVQRIEFSDWRLGVARFRDSIPCYPDPPNSDPDTNYHGPNGEHGWLYGWLKDGMYSFNYGDCQWDCDGEGHVAST
jgi:uncharacterized protein (TIGR02996 family)